MKHRQLHWLWILLVVAAVLAVSAAYPSHHLTRNANFMSRRSLLDCSQSRHLTMKCERCAKDSRSDDAFTMCCADVPGVRSWCDKFLAYGSDDASLLHKRWVV